MDSVEDDTPRGEPEWIDHYENFEGSCYTVEDLVVVATTISDACLHGVENCGTMVPENKFPSPTDEGVIIYREPITTESEQEVAQQSHRPRPQKNERTQFSLKKVDDPIQGRLWVAVVSSTTTK